MDNGQLDPKVLGQLLLMQSLIINLPNEKSIFSFVCKGLLDIPGVSKVEFCEIKSEPDNIPLKVSYPVYLENSYFGELHISLSDRELYTPYDNYVSNFVFMIGVILEERKQRQVNLQNQLLLEQRVFERTQELIIEKEKLIESQRRFSDLMKNVRLLTLMLDIEGNIIFCNKFFLYVTKYTYNEIIGKNWFKLFIKKDITEDIKQVFSRLVSGDESGYNYENEIITKTGEKLMIAWNNTILLDSKQKIVGTASIGENITERKIAEEALVNKNKEYKFLNEEYSSLNEKLIASLENLKNINAQLEIAKEKAEESDRLKTAFLQNMSHEIRTPMNAIMGFSSLLTQQNHNKQIVEKFCKIINRRSNDLLDIINDILDIAKIESGQLTINLEVFNLSELIDELLLFFKEYKIRIGKEHIQFSFAKHHSIKDCEIFSDKGKLKQILINLISNALKFTDVGKVKVSCKIGNNNTISFHVSDTGYGIPVDKQQIIFERFTQLQNSEIKNIGGTGLGLSIVKGLAHLLEGEIFLESEPGKGSTFSLIIPVKKAVSNELSE